MKMPIAEYPRIQGNISKIQKTVVTDVREVLDYGRHKVEIAIFQSNSDKGLKKSMADRGFERYDVMITVGCSVGSAYMPESTARLVFIF